MIDTQLHYAHTVRGARSRHALHRARHPRRPRTPALLRERAHDVVCLHGEANAWPARASAGHRAEESFTGSRAARAPARRSRRSSPRAARWRPGSPSHIRLSRRAARVRRELGRVPRALGGVDARRRRRLRVGAVSAGSHGGGRCGAARRARRHASGGGHVPGRAHGIAEDCSARLGVAIPDAFAAGRGGARMAALSAIVDRMISEPLGVPI